MKSVKLAHMARPASAMSGRVLVAVGVLAMSAYSWSYPALAQNEGTGGSFEFFVPGEGQDIGGIYWLKSYSAAIQTVDGGVPPYTPEALAIYEEKRARIEASAEIIEEDQARGLCTPDGVPRVLQSPYPFEIVQTQGQIHFLYEINKIIRLVTMDEPLPDDDTLEIFPWYSGHSVGHWEGDTLVVETGGFKNYTFLDNLGAPHGYGLRVTERYRKISDGNELEVVVDIHDPGVFTEDWSARFVYDLRPDLRMMDWNCGEVHRDISQVPGVVIPE
jgi:hypothetical protein